MADIVARLREINRYYSEGGEPQEWCGKAADEIERLRAALRVARLHVQATNDAEHMMDGFGPWKERPSDLDLSMIDDALGDEQNAGGGKDG